MVMGQNFLFIGISTSFYLLLANIISSKLEKLHFGTYTIFQAFNIVLFIFIYMIFY